MATATAAEQLEAAAEVSTLAGELAPQIEADRRLPPTLVQRLRQTGLTRATAPGVTLQTAETIARGDGSTGWCVSIAATSSLLAGWLPPEGREEIFGDPHHITAGVWAPRGRASRVDGGYRVSGRWPFCSGIPHCEYFFGGALVADEGAGQPVIRVMGMPVAELEVLDTWHTAGLRGTGSHDVVATEVFVPERPHLLGLRSTDERRRRSGS